ncbi:hypothetical protein [Corynebacterium sp.]|uniref:hypothetical protein n=1 Tax=Corynebacterium sp. TaxID=1720 RepID=UPI003B3B00D6
MAGVRASYEMKMPAVFGVLPPVVLAPSAVGLVATGSWTAGIVVVVLLVVFEWAIFTATVQVSLHEDEVEFRAPFYRRCVPYRQVNSVEVTKDFGLNPGLLNWPVVGRTESRRGVRLNVGGSAALRVSARGGQENITVMFAQMAEARTCARDIEAAR